MTLAGRALNLLLPPRCLSCGTVVEAAGTLCPDCWAEVTFLGPPQCACCGLPFEVDLGEGTLCGGCLRHPPVWDRARAALAYDDGSRSMILSFKHGDRTDAAPAFAAWMARAGRELLDDAEVLVPVPLHWTRLWGRRYNQAALLARELCRHTDGAVFRPQALVRLRRTRMMGKMNAAERRRTLRGAIGPGVRAEQGLRGKRVLLIDDVLTSGATVKACCRALERVGVSGVDVLTLARVVRPAD